MAIDKTKTKIRALTVADLQRVVEIDNKLSGDLRLGFFAKRLAAALARPGSFIYVGAEDSGELAGYALVQLLEGEFGGTAPVAVLDAIGVDPAHQGRGVGRALMAGLEDVMRHKGVAEMRTQVDWTNHTLMRFLDDAGFERAPRLVLERPTAEPVAF